MTNAVSDPRSKVSSPTFIDRRLCTVAPHDPRHWLVDSPHRDPSGLWGASRLAAMDAARTAGLPVCAAKAIPFKGTGGTALPVSGEQIFQGPGCRGPLLVERTEACISDGQMWSLQTRSAWDDSPRKGFEEEGGPGLPAIFAFIDAHSSAPIADIQTVLRWVLVSWVLGHTEVNAGHVVLITTGTGSRLAPFGWLTAFPAAVGGIRYPLAKGLKIGTNWADDFTMVHQWIQLAAWARVKPKIVFTMAADVCSTLPQAFERAFQTALGAVTHRGIPEKLVQLVNKRAQRLREVSISAPGQGVAGLKKVAVGDVVEGDGPVITRNADGTERRFFKTVVDDDFE